MKFIADLHIHSRFSRATARNLDPEHLSLWAQKKGIAVIGTGDFTHPGWVTELKEKLEEAETGLYRLRPEIQEQVDINVPASCKSPSRFVLSGEISCIYKKAGKTRKVHHLILMPDFASVERFNDQLSRVGNVVSDGRPILGLDSRVLLEMALQASDRTFFIPAHVWTPWFSLFGSKSGFDTLEECFDDLSPYIHALETGLSSDPPMNRRLSQLDRYLLVSNSDAHSPANLGREANLFDTELSYGRMVGAMTRGEGFCGTIEFFPEEGKYHLDGHRKCQVRMEPMETKGVNGICPVCGRPLTVGVLHRVDDLADRKDPPLHKPFFSLIPLAEILSELLGCGRGTVKVETLYERLLTELGPELPILLEMELERLEKAAGPVLAEAIGRMRKGEVVRAPGYDGEYGTIRLFAPGEMGDVTGQMAFFQMQEKPSPIKASFEPARRIHGATTPPGQTFAPHAAPGPAPPHDDPILDPLNEEQREAVLSGNDHLLASAGPGTGKTAVLTHRMAYLIREGTAAAHSMLALTFTRKAAGEMAQRLSSLLGQSTDVRVETFHGFCLQVLRDESEHTDLPPDFSLCSEREAEEITRRVAEEGKLGKRIVTRFLKALPRLKTLDSWPSGGEDADDELLVLFRRYQAKLRALGMVDFDDLEVDTLRLFKDHPEVCHRYGHAFRWVFVDEYQDTNPIQAAIVKTLVNGGGGRLFAIGDPDQAIYGFRGADQANFFRFPLDFPTTHKINLTRNYRSSEPILQAAAAILQKEQPLTPSSSGGDPVMLSPCRTEAEEAEMVVEQIERLMGGTSHFVIDSGRTGPGDGEPSLGFGDFAVLYRLNGQGLALEEAFRRAGIPYARSGETPLVARYPVNLLWRFLQTRTYPGNPYYAKAYSDVLSGSGLKFTPDQIFVLPTIPLDAIETAVRIHGIVCEEERERDAFSGLRRFASTSGGDLRSFVDGLSLERGIDHTRLPGDRVVLMSIHAAKGLEWPVVFITGCEDQLIPCTLFGDRDDEEERRLLYVGMTRARQRLILSWAQRRTIGGRSLQMAPSPFLSLIPKGVCQTLGRKRPKPRVKSGKQLRLFD